MMLTVERLRECLEYEPVSGLFIRVYNRNPNFVGKIAGSRKKEGKNTYIRIRIDGNDYYAHRLAFLYMTGEWPDIVDHIDRNGINNSWDNLRNVDKSINGHNRGENKNNTSGIKGVHFVTATGKWWSYIEHNYCRRNLGYYDNLLDAACARKSAERSADILLGE